MKRCLLALLGLLVTGMAAAQSGTVKATVWDTESQSGLPGAVIELTSKKDPNLKNHYTSGYNGEVSMPKLRYGDYTLSVSFLGYETATRELRVAASSVNMGRIELSPSAQQIEAVVKEVQALRTSQKGDTLSYNAAAFKVAVREGSLVRLTLPKCRMGASAMRLSGMAERSRQMSAPGRR